MTDKKSNHIKTDEKKQHFDDIYVAPDPVAYKEKILDELEYISDNYNRKCFDRLILPWAREKQKQGQPINFVDLCGCFGNTSLATLFGMDYHAICQNWRNSEACQTIQAQRRLQARTSGIDISAPALEYGKQVGIYDQIIQVNLNKPQPPQREAIRQCMQSADIVICTAALVYLEKQAIQMILEALGSGEQEGYMMVNFLNPFALDAADATKRLLLEHLDFVGSMASHHRRLSELEQQNYPGEKWALLEIWVLKRRAV